MKHHNVGAKKTRQMCRNYISEMKNINARFNEELQRQIEGNLLPGHVYDLGCPEAILRAAGVDDLPVELASRVLSQKAGKGNKHFHPFDLSEVRDLPRAINDPVAVFSYGDKTKAVNIITKIEQNGKQFLVGLSLNPEIQGAKLNINSVMTIFPKDTHEWLSWIDQGKTLYLNKKEMSSLLANPRLPEDVTNNPTLKDAIGGFQNPPISNIGDIPKNVNSKTK